MASASFVSSASSFTTACTTSLAVDMPGSLSASNVLVVFLGMRNVSTPSATPPAGFTNLGISACDGTTGANIQVFWRIATGTEGAACTFTISASNQMAAAVGQYSNIDTACPFDVYVAASAGGTTAATKFGTVTTTSASELILYAANIVGAGGTITNDAALTEREEVGSTGTNNTTTWLGDELQAASGLSTQRTNTLSASQRNVEITIALKTASAAGAGNSQVFGMLQAMTGITF